MLQQSRGVNESFSEALLAFDIPICEFRAEG